jgi:hypothetical protein
MATYLIGEDNPHSPDPAMALLPDDPGSAGWRLFMLSGLTREQYERAFIRVNARDNPLIMTGSRSIVLGKSAWKMLGLAPVEWFWVHHQHGSRWTLIPHPSGKNLMYNDPLNRDLARGILRGAAIEEMAA